MAIWDWLSLRNEFKTFFCITCNLHNLLKFKASLFKGVTALNDRWVVSQQLHLLQYKCQHVSAANSCRFIFFGKRADCGFKENREAESPPGDSVVHFTRLNFFLINRRGRSTPQALQETLEEWFSLGHSQVRQTRVTTL